MSRQTKFRALVDDMAMGWAYGNIVYQGDVPRIQESNSSPLLTTCLKGTESQYTGLRDKNGKEIYEGDLLRKFSNEDGSLLVWGPVVFNSCAAFVIRRGLDFKIESRPELYEIIGNIHENPELLKA